VKEKFLNFFFSSSYRVAVRKLFYHSLKISFSERIYGREHGGNRESLLPQKPLAMQ
jgi:hypothetical protein